MVKNPLTSAGATEAAGSIPGSVRSPGGNGNLYTCWDNSKDRSLEGYGPWGRKESDTTEHTPPHITDYKRSYFSL